MHVGDGGGGGGESDVGACVGASGASDASDALDADASDAGVNAGAGAMPGRAMVWMSAWWKGVAVATLGCGDVG